jgi:hypothetical protein
VKKLIALALMFGMLSFTLGCSKSDTKAGTGGGSKAETKEASKPAP